MGAADIRQRIGSCSSDRRVGLLSIPLGCGGWNSGTPPTPTWKASITSNAWPCSVGSGIVNTRPSRVALFDLPSSEARSSKHVWPSSSNLRVDVDAAPGDGQSILSSHRARALGLGFERNDNGEFSAFRCRVDRNRGIKL